MNLKHDRDLVIQKGIQLFCSQGYTNLGIDKICLETDKLHTHAAQTPPRIKCFLS